MSKRKSKNRNAHLSAACVAVLAGGSFLLAPTRADESLQRFVFEKAAMGVPFRITLYAPAEATAKAAADAAFERVAVLNSILSDYDPDSELSRLARTSGQGKIVPVSSILWTVLERGQALAERTGGAFDLTVGPLVNVWRRARRKGELPAPELLAETRARIGYRHVRLHPSAKSVELLEPEMRLDPGGIAKGLAVDEALAVLEQRGLTRALVAASGDIAAGDPPPGQPGWRVEVAALDAPDAPPPQIVHLESRAISTSGDVFQRVEIGGKRYSHIVNPHTGIGLTDHSLVTVVAPDGITADSLATAVSVLGPEQGLKLIEETPGTAAQIVRQPGERIERLESSRWKEEVVP
ncbi:MAG: FAD:protein FMN transferase [Verrucomicrobiota bacterium]|nr:FAD:protein FMN transferase [Verrucomicrobiota bacterium]